ncbi:hypothetical protein AUEXF2481DRAFT_31869 [Aureobasidium subglaciale EXF-2481]|uniref:Non-haem dioxygenase N-terminal domain-containing protein n=1 Tax=Aureobasidium subglaciale (strain EXF-2481) TaxID=1043005 RepID=A0A074Y4D2_AURSE|nr:uncharacterized protein AUEXF2481DRAFT_31869 [Aureobasidium subglaciale EXF-2481]KEQ92613.1 hypothetical protein AUEXF2481DRAFT_31869 [Aureobasidium subglaciale EXF-2481]
MNTSTAFTSLDKANLPIIDYSRIEVFLAESPPENLTENFELLNAVNDIGFINLSNHGTTEGKLKKLFDHTMKFSFCAKSGDLLSRWFDDDLRSVEHGVAGPLLERLKLDAQDRLPPRFIPAGCKTPNRNAWIEPLSSCIIEQDPQRFEDVWAGKHIADRIARLHKDDKIFEMWQKSMYRDNSLFIPLRRGDG